MVYLDDFFICAPRMEECAIPLNTLIVLLRELEYYINWDKVVDPIQSITFLGIQIDI